MFGFGGLQLMEGSQQDAISLARVVGYLPEAFVSARSTLLDVSNLRAVTERSLSELPLRQLGGLAEGGQAFAEGTAKHGYGF
jgi:hypothetical protein